MKSEAPKTRLSCKIEDNGVYIVEFDNPFYKFKPYSKKALYKNKRDVRYVSTYEAAQFFARNEQNVKITHALVWGVEEVPVEEAA